MENQSRKFFAALLIATCLSVLACEQEPRQTVFEGKVLSRDNGVPLTDVFVYITGYRIASIYRYPIINFTVPVDQDGGFRLVVPYQEGLKNFSVQILPDNGPETVPFDISLMDCSPNNCEHFLAGKTYKFDIRVSDPD